MILRFSSRADQDLEDITEYSMRRQGLSRGEAYIARLYERIRKLETFPYLGTIDPDFNDSSRVLVVGAHRVIYTVVADEVIVARVLTAGQEG